jgi:hypothetical protein
MKLRKQLTGLFAFILTLALTIGLASPAWVQPKPLPAANLQPPALFSPAPGGRGRGAASPEQVVRQRYVTPNTALLVQTRGGKLTLNLFEDAVYPVVVEAVEEQTPKAPSTGRGRGTTLGQGDRKPITIIFGRVSDLPDSEVYLARQNDLISGSVRLPDGKLYTLAPADRGAHVIQEINPSAFPPDEPPELWQKLQARGRGASPDQRSTRGAAPATAQTSFKALSNTKILKTYVLYTPQAEKLAGGADAMSLLIAQLQMQTNQGFRQSNVNLRVSIEGWEQQSNYAETGDAEKDLNIFGKWVGEKDLRSKLGVDVVSLWVSKLNSCGIAPLNQTSDEFRQQAFNVVDLRCAANNFSFAHELGHNLGSCHDLEADPKCTGSFPFSFGYQDPDGDFRTIMSYPCKVNDKCPRLNVWSNPDLSTKKRNKPLGMKDKADNARSLNRVT